MRISRALAFLLPIACATPPPPVVRPPSPSEYHAIVRAEDRTKEDRELDAGRRPEEFLAFTRVQSGMSVGELFAGGGYTTELLARVVGVEGKVYAQNPPELLKQFIEAPWSARLQRPVNRNVRRLDLPLDAPFPSELNGTLDLVVSNANYHDAVWMRVDRPKMNRHVRAALKPDGAYVVCDSSARLGTGVDDAETLHRIEELTVEQEILAAGFKLESRGDFLRNPADTRDWSVSPRTVGERRGTGDRFCLRFLR